MSQARRCDMGIVSIYDQDKLTYYPIKVKQKITVGPELDDTVTLAELNHQDSFSLTCTDQGHLMIESTSLAETVELEHGQEQAISCIDGEVHVYWINKWQTNASYYVDPLKEIHLLEEQADEQQATIKQTYHSTAPLTIYPNQQLIKLNNDDAYLYLNGKRCVDQIHYQVGDQIVYKRFHLAFFEEDVLEIRHPHFVDIELEEVVVPQSEMQKRYPVYRRTPRMVYELPDNKVKFSLPGQEPDHTGKSLWMIVLPPLMMLIIMSLIAILIPRGIFMLVSVVMFMTTLVTSTVQYFKDKKLRAEREEKRKRIYSNYLEEKRTELEAVSEKQRFVMQFHFPTFERMKYLTAQVSDRIWERTLDSKDFLQFRLGTGTVPSSYQITVNAADMSNREMDELLEESQLLERTYRELKDLPVTANLADGAIGLIGKEVVWKRELHQIIGQLAFFHSYHDLRFVLVFDEKDYPEWQWLKRLPHFQLPQSYAKGFIYNERTRDQLLTSIYEWIRERDLEEDKEKIRFKPHFLFIVINQELINEHVILEYLEGEHHDLGLSVIFAAEAKESFSNHINTLIRYINANQGDILIENKRAVQIPFTLDQHQLKDNETYARTLRTLDHQVGMTNSIPERVSFLEMLDIQDINALPIKENWLTNASAKSLAAPIGLKGKKDIVSLNLHEKAHGPHGLLAGTTGSGKSEFLQTYILSLAVHYHPYEVAFLLIDYKGGGMAQPFRHIPHLLGTITNIEGSKNFSARALASIKSELKRRQRLFDQYQVNHINDYTKLFKQGETREPLPHLFLISDEFAELKTEEPDFIRELVSAARIGRSLGVHLILATQKPGGVIDDQIWSNARFRVALKVQNAEDSREILKNADAAALTVTGRGYLQVGSNEVYQLFQSAWSGAPYQDESSTNEDEVALVTDLGLVPLSELSTAQSSGHEARTEMDLVVDKIEAVHKEMNFEQLASPWLPPLGERLYFNDIEQPSTQEQLIFAIVDEPEKQSQTPIGYEPMADGNIGIFGSSGYGKTYTIYTLLLQFARLYRPDQLHFYLMDFGNGGLLPFKQLAHTADYFLLDEEKKLNKLVSLIQNEMSRRKVLFQEFEVSSIKMFNHLSEEPIPLWFITIDNFDVVKDELQDLETQINQFARDGQSLGIYFIISSTRVNAVRQALMNNLKTKIVHYLLDPTEGYAMLGRVPFALENVPGRAIVKMSDPYLAQVVLPVGGEDDYQQLEELKAEIKQINHSYHDVVQPDPIPMLPKNLTTAHFKDFVKQDDRPGVIPIGLHEELVKPIMIDLNKINHCLVIGGSQSGKTNVMRHIVNQLLTTMSERLTLFDSIDRGFSNLVQNEKVNYIESKEAIEQWLDETEAMFKEREQAYLSAVSSGQPLPQFEVSAFIIDGYARFLRMVDNRVQERIVQLLKSYSHLGFQLMVSGNNNELTKGFDPLTVEIKQVRQAILLMKKTDQTLFNLAYERKEPDFQTGYGYFVENGKEVRMQIPYVATEREKVSIS